VTSGTGTIDTWKRDDVRWRKEEGRWMRDSKGMTMYKEK
jgi:hypothetical protein